MWGKQAIFQAVWALFLGLSSLLSAQGQQGLEARCFQLQRPGSNTTLNISLDPSVGAIGPDGVLQTDLDFQIEFRSLPDRQLVLEKKFHEVERPDFLSGKDPFFRDYQMELPPGDYLVDLTVQDRQSGQRHWTSFSYACQATEATWISDVLLLQERVGAIDPTPLVGPSVGGITDRIRFRSEVYQSQDEYLTARAILYRQQDRPPGKDDRDRMQITQYTAVVQVNEVLQPEQGQAVFSGGFDLGELAQGRYLLEIFLYQDDSIIAEKNRSFVLPWRQLKDVFFNLERSIQQMAYISPPDFIEELQNEDDPGEQNRRFMAFWASRAEPRLEEATDALEGYYSRIFYANEFFSEPDQEGWKTARGRTFTLYGSPDDQFNRDWQGNIYEVWSYDDMGMYFVFQSQAGHWNQVFPEQNAKP